MGDRIIIIDGNSLINRAYYAMQRPMITKDGIYTQGIYGFINMLNKILDDYSPEYIAVAWDRKAPTFRHEEYKEYKAGRKKMPMELAMEFPIMKDILTAMNITNLEIDGFEADDIIGSLARIGEEEGLSPLIITGDKDALQLATDVTHILITKRGISEFDLYDRDKMIERYQLTPEQFIDLKGLMGDQSDNIPGIPGVGEKTGIKLLTQFGSVANLLANTDEISNVKLRTKVEENAQLAAMSRRLATINKYVPLDFNIEDMKYVEPNYTDLIDLYVKLEFNNFLKKLHAPADIGSFDEMEKIEYNKVIIKTTEELEVLNDIPSESEVFIKVFSDFNHVSMPTFIGMGILYNNSFYYLNITTDEFEKKLIDIFNNKHFSFSGHELVKDYYVLIRKGIENINTSFDSSIAQYVLEPTKSNYELKTLTFEEMHYKIKSEKEFNESSGQLDLFGNNLEDYYNYCLTCLEAVYRLKSRQINKIKAEDLENVLYNVELPLIEVLASMEAEGFTTNKETLDEIGNVIKEELINLEKAIYAMAGEEFNINSPVQLGDILFEKLKLPAGKKTKRGYSTSADVLEKIKDKHSIVPSVLQYRTLSKLNSTYIEGLKPLIGNDNKIRAHFQQTVTATGRISCTEPNLQNIPIRQSLGRQIRKAFAPSSKEHVLIGADYSQIELRILAHLSNDETLISAFNNGDDIHKITASRVFDLPLDQVTSLDRSRAKAVNFGVIYGMSGFGLSEELKITRKEAETYIKDYFKKHEAVKSYLDNQVLFTKENGYSTTILGRKRAIPEISSSSFMTRNFGERLAMNSPIQGSAADIIKIAMIKVYKQLQSDFHNSKLILQIHDELIIDASLDEADKIKEMLIKNMESAMDLKVKLESDLNVGSTWYELK